MGLFGNKAYDRWKKEVDEYPVLEKGSALITVEALTANLARGAGLIKKIQEAGARGELTADQANELVTRFQARARKGVGM